MPIRQPKTQEQSALPPLDAPLILGIETSCDETAAAVSWGQYLLLSSVISSQIPLHRPYGGVVPELASRNHLTMLRPIVQDALAQAGHSLEDLDALAATLGPGLSSSLLTGATLAKSLAWTLGKPFLGVNHLEGHLLSPFEGHPEGVEPCVALVVSGGHTLLIEVRGFDDYHLLGRTHDDAAGEAFDKVAKMIGLPYPGGPEIDKRARHGDPRAFEFPRSMLDSQDLHFSFSGLKTSARYKLETLRKDHETLPEEIINDLCAGFQEAIVDVLSAKLVAACRQTGRHVAAVSGGVSLNSRLRRRLEKVCEENHIELLLAKPQLCTDNAGMICHAAAHALANDRITALDRDIDPNLGLTFRNV